MPHSWLTRNAVPHQTPTAPSARAAATPRPSQIPPAATTGIGLTASTICGISGKLPMVRCVHPLFALRDDHVRALACVAEGVFHGAGKRHHFDAKFVSYRDNLRGIAKTDDQNRNFFFEYNFQLLSRRFGRLDPTFSIWWLRRQAQLGYQLVGKFGVLG